MIRWCVVWSVACSRTANPGQPSRLSRSGEGIVGAMDARAMLRRDIERSGYYPDLVDDSLTTALGSESLLEFVVHQFY